jgi:hypothetical protein
LPTGTPGGHYEQGKEDPINGVTTNERVGVVLLLALAAQGLRIREKATPDGLEASCRIGL